MPVGATKKQVMHISSMPPDVRAHPSVFVCLPPSVYDPSKDYGQALSMFVHPHAQLQSGTTYTCPFCHQTFSSQ